MQTKLWFRVACLCLLSCGGSDGGDPSGAKESSKARAAGALTGALHFPGGLVRKGNLPPTDEERVRLLLDASASFVPGETGLMQFEEDNPLAREDTSEAVLMQFEEHPEHVRVPVSSSVAGRSDINLEFTVDDDLCDALCDTTITLEVTVALELESGAIGAHRSATVTVDCRGRGDPEKCGSGQTSRPTDETADGGTGSGGSRPDPTIDPAATAAAESVVMSINDYAQELCNCFAATIAPESCLASAGGNRDCLTAAVAPHVESAMDYLDCLKMFYAEQTQCLVDAACDPMALEACVAAQQMGTDSWTVLESSCGPPPSDLQADADACQPQFPCADGSAEVSLSVRCDRTTDCSDGSDEVGCDVATGFVCSNGDALMNDLLCDGTNDCADGTDELLCIPCVNGTGTYSPLHQCDGMDTCADGTDEQSCMYNCASGEVIVVTKVCDMTEDCTDGSDESSCTASDFPCSDGSGTVPLMTVCDGTNDCADGSDEDPMLCG